MFFIFVLNNAISGLIVKQILQKAGPRADAGWDIIRATAPGPRALGPDTHRFCLGLQVPLLALPEPSHL